MTSHPGATSTAGAITKSCPSAAGQLIIACLKQEHGYPEKNWTHTTYTSVAYTSMLLLLFFSGVTISGIGFTVV